MLLKKSSPLVLTILCVATAGLVLGLAPSCSTVADCPVGVDCSVGGAGGGEGGAGGAGTTTSSAGGAGGAGGNGGGGGASHCENGVKDGDEEGIDCGGTECNGCLNDPCSTGADCASGTCGEEMPTVCVCPAGMALNAALGGAFCIDAYEVTNEAYAVFRAATLATGFQWDETPECSWNDNVTPADGFLTPVDRPVVGIDWCDARAYCKWNGKRLCGAVSGGQSDFDDFAMAGSSAWFNACSLGGEIEYPYAPDYNPVTCNGDGDANLTSIGSSVMTDCVGSPAGLFHMSGNVAEWEDSCETDGAGGSGGAGGAGGAGGVGGAGGGGGSGGGGSDEQLVPCRARGGSFKSGLGALHCAADAYSPRSYTAPDLGFRCCL